MASIKDSNAQRKRSILYIKVIRGLEQTDIQFAVGKRTQSVCDWKQTKRQYWKIII